GELPWYQYLLAVCFLSVSTRTAGFCFAQTGLDNLRASNACVFCACMWISACPVVAVMRSTTCSETGEQQAVAISSMLLNAPKSDVSWARAKLELRGQISNFMTQDTALLAVLFFVIILGEEADMTTPDVRDGRFLRVLFEFCSSYGTVGLSMSETPWSESGNWSPVPKLALMAVMFLGRLRGMPPSIDATIRFRRDDDWVDEPELLTDCIVQFSYPGLFSACNIPSTEHVSEVKVANLAHPKLTRADGLGPKQVQEPVPKARDTAFLDNVRWLNTMAYRDEGKVVKVYLEFPVDLKDATITCEWERFGVELLARLPNGQIHGVRVRDAEGWILEHERKNGWAHEIVPEKCKWRLSSSGPKISLTLTKKDEGEKWSELKKVDIKSTFKPGS
ncbi:unnamed protein product, partial [Polarella glacialis]